MTMTTDSCVITYAGNGELTEFPYNFKIFTEMDLKAVVRDIEGNETHLVPGVDFSVTGTGTSEGGNVTYPNSGDPLPQNATLTLYREIPFTQTLELVENDPFPADLIEQQFDRAVMRDQQIKERLDRALAYSMAAPEEARLTAEEYVEALTEAKETTRSQADSASTARTEAEAASNLAASSAALAFQQAERAGAASVNVQSMVAWWSELSTAATQSTNSSFTVPGDLTSIFTTGRAVKLTAVGSNSTETGYVVGSSWDGSNSTEVTITCSVPSEIESIEYGQAVENSPHSGPAAMAPEVTGPSEGNEKSVLEFTAHRNDGSDYTAEVRYEVTATRANDAVDASTDFTLATVDPQTIRLTLPSATEDTSFILRFRASDGVLGLSDPSEPLQLTVKHLDMIADNAAILTTTPADWPIQNDRISCSKTVGQEEDEPDWTNVSALLELDATKMGCCLTVDDYSTGTLQCSDSRSGLTGPWAMKPVGSDHCVVVETEPSEVAVPAPQILGTPDIWGNGANYFSRTGQDAICTSANTTMMTNTTSGTLSGDFNLSFNIVAGDGGNCGPNLALVPFADAGNISVSTWCNHMINQPCWGCAPQTMGATGFGTFQNDESGASTITVDNGTTAAIASGDKITYKRRNGVISVYINDVRFGVYNHTSTEDLILSYGAYSTTCGFTNLLITGGDDFASYTWTDLNQTPYGLASVEAVYKLPACYVGTGGEVSIPQVEAGLEIVNPDDITPTMTGETKDGFTITGSGYDPAYNRYPWYTMTDSLSYFWQESGSALPAWLKVSNTNGMTVSGITITPYSVAHTQYCPKNFVVQGSNNNTDWVDLYTGINVTYPDSEKQTFMFPGGVVTYDYIRLYITAVEDSTWVIVGEFELLGWYDPLKVIYPTSDFIFVGTELILNGSQTVEVTAVSENTTTNSLIPQTEGTVIGNMTSNGGIASAFDGEVDASATSAALVASTVGYVGKTYTRAVHVTKFVLSAPSDDYLNGSAVAIDLELQGSNDDFATYNTLWTGAAATSLAAVMEVDSGIASGEYTSIRMVFGDGGDAGYNKCGELAFYETYTEYTCTINPAASSAVTSAATTGTPLKMKELMIPETELEVVSKNGTALVVKYPAALTGLNKMAQHNKVRVNGSTDVVVTDGGTEEDVDEGVNKQTTFTLAEDPGSVASAVLPSRFPASAESVSSVARSDFAATVEEEVFKPYTAETSQYTGAILARYGTFPAGTHFTGMSAANTTDGACKLGVFEKSGTTVIPRYLVDATFSGGVAYADMDYTTPDENCTLGVYFSGQQMIGEKGSYTLDDTLLNTGQNIGTPQIGTAYSVTANASYTTTVTGWTTGGIETHDKLTMTYETRLLDTPARSTAVMVQKQAGMEDATFNAAVNLCTGA